MQSKPELFEANAARCKELAGLTKTSEARELYHSLALQWLQLAAMLRMLSADLETARNFMRDLTPDA